MASDEGRSPKQRRKSGAAEALDNISHLALQKCVCPLDRLGEGPVGAGSAQRWVSGILGGYSPPPSRVNVLWRIVGNGGDHGGEH